MRGFIYVNHLTPPQVLPLQDMNFLSVHYETIPCVIIYCNNYFTKLLLLGCLLFTS